jgi:regulator of sigma E protease
VTDGDGRAMRTARLDLSSVTSRDVDAAFMRQVGLGPAFSEPVLGDVKAGGPAALAGLRAGDRVLSVDGQPIGDAATLRERIRGAVRDGAAVDQRWLLQRGDRSLEVTVRPRLTQDAQDTRLSIARIDAYVGQPPEMVKVTYGPIEGITKGAQRTWEVSVLTLRMMGRMLIGEASLKNLSGPLTIADFAGQSVNQGLAYYLGFLALVSVSLGVLNLLPLPMLDGGHLMYYLFEGITGRPVSDAWLARLQRGGVVVLLMMMSVALFNDVARLLGLH